MGVIHGTTRIEPLAQSGQAYKADFFVKTGAIDCMTPARILNEAGVAVEGKGVYELANGTVVEYPYGFARVGFMGAETVAQVISGPNDCDPIVGVVALGNTGIGVDPVTQTPTRLAAKPLKIARKQ